MTAKPIPHGCEYTAIHYGAHDEPVRITVTGEESDVRTEVANRSLPIHPATLSQIFEPLKRGMGSADHPAGLGLGPYIVREVAKAHGGTAEARSNVSETVFSMRLPR